MKVMLMVRDPVRRAASQYFRYVRRGREAREPSEAMFGEEADPHAGAYRMRGRYHEHLDLLHAHFPAEQILVLRLEDLCSAPAAVMRRVTNFLCLSQLTRRSYPAANQGTYPPLREALGDQLVEDLRAYFAPHNAALYQKYGIRVEDWA